MRIPLGLHLMSGTRAGSRRKSESPDEDATPRQPAASLVPELGLWPQDGKRGQRGVKK